MNSAAKDVRSELSSYKSELQETQEQVQLVDQARLKKIFLELLRIRAERFFVHARFLLHSFLGSPFLRDN